MEKKIYDRSMLCSNRKYNTTAPCPTVVKVLHVKDATLLQRENVTKLCK